MPTQPMEPERFSPKTGEVVDVSRAIESLPSSLREPLEEMLSSSEKTGDINEEGLPVYDIREEVDSQDTRDGPLIEEMDISEDGKESEEYWSKEAVAKRRQLRQKLLDSDDDEDEQQEPHETIAKPPPDTKPRLPKQPSKGFMLASRSLNSDTPEDVATADLVESIPDIKERESLGENGGQGSVKGKGRAQDQTPPPTIGVKRPRESSSKAADPARRKSVTFAPQTMVRTYEKGGVIPTSTPVSSISSPETPTASSTTGPSSPFAGFKKGFLNAKPTQSRTMSAAVPLESNSAKIEMIEDVQAPSAHNVKTAQIGSRTSSPKKPSQPSPRSPFSSSAGAQFRSEIVMDPDFPLPDDVKARLGVVGSGVETTSELAPFQTPDSLQPLAPAHQDDETTTSHKTPQRKSLFALRKEAFSNPNSFASSRSPASQDVSAHPVREHVVETGPVGTGRTDVEPNDQGSEGPVKFKVVEKPPSVSSSVRGSTRLEAQKGSDMKPQIAKQAVGGVVERELPHTVADVGAEDGDESEEDDQMDIDSEDDRDSNASYEYSDTDSVNFDLDHSLLVREAAMAYHQKRSTLGRKALGGWTGQVDEQGKTGFYHYTDDIDQATEKSQAVGFGEKVIPGAKLRELDVSREDDDDDDDQGVESVSLPTLIPGAESLPSMIRIGKLENGNLILQADQEDDHEDDGEGATMTKDSEGSIAPSNDKDAKQENKKAIIARLGKGQVEEMIREEQERESIVKAARLTRDQVHPDAPPLVRTAPAQDDSERAAGSSTSPVNKVQAVGEAVVERAVSNKTASLPVQEGQGETPKKVSRFKAARMGKS